MKTLFFGLYLMILMISLHAKADEKMIHIEFEQGMTFTAEKNSDENSITQTKFKVEDVQNDTVILELDNNN